MNKSAIYHSATSPYCYPLAENTLYLSIRTAKDIKSVALFWADPFDSTYNKDKIHWNVRQEPITECKELQENLLWSIAIKVPFCRVKYYFKLSDGQGCLYYFEDGIYSEEKYKVAQDELERTGNVNNLRAFIYPYLNKVDITKVSSWAKTAIFYQIFPSRFNKIPSSYTEEACRAKNLTIKEWPTFSTPTKFDDRYGGNIQGITSRLPYLSKLGITALYLNPINESPSEHKYDTTDYLKIDSTFGTEEDVKELVSKAHALNIKVIFDAVFNHCGWKFWAWQDVCANRERSKYAKWFMINDFSFTTTHTSQFKSENTRAGKYASFAFADYMPKFNTAEEEVQEYLIGVVKTWIDKFDIDGIRVDVANEISHTFLQRLRKKIDSYKQDFYFLCEAWHNAQNFLLGGEFNSVMNYPLQYVLLDYAMDKIEAKEVEWGINRCYSMYQKQVNSTLFNLLDSHDTARFVTFFGNNQARAQSMLALLFSLAGTPCIYYGTEILLEGGADPDNRRCIPWERVDKGEYDNLLEWTKTLIKIRKTHPALASERIKFLYDLQEESVNNKVPNKERILDIVKECEEESASYKEESVEIIVNFSGKPLDIKTKLPSRSVIFSTGYKEGLLNNNGFVYII